MSINLTGGLLMRTTIFSVRGDDVAADVNEAPNWEPFERFEDKPLERVGLVEVASPPGARVQLVEIRAGGRFAMHSSPEVAFCQIVRGRGKLGLPGGRELNYEGPELFLFQPGTLHDWHGVTEDTLLAVCLVAQP
jgi:quercetin dioxygenase-like cupin family protein